MSASSENTKERVQGAAQELGGNIKKNVGNAIGNRSMEADGKRQEVEGQARQETAKAAERARGAGQEAKGSVKKTVGQLIGNEQMEAEGEADKLTGEARQKANR